MSRFAHILDFVREEIALRDAQPAGILSPSDYWKDFNRFSSYIRTLPDDELKYIRRHTWHLTGERYSAYHFISNRAKREIIAEYEALLPGLGSFRPHEPPNGFGIDSPYGCVNQSVVRYAMVIADLHPAGFLPRRNPMRILEIGGGYGGLALLCTQFNPEISYVICDLEESLFVQGVFLSQHLGEGRLRLADGGALAELRPGHVYLLPQSRAHVLETIHFDLAINQQSMQEMTEAQVGRYCEILQKSAARFYSCNRRSHGRGIVEEKGLVADLHTYLGARLPVLWDSTDHATPLVRASQRHKLVRKLLSAVIGKSYLPQGERALRRFVYRCAP